MSKKEVVRIICLLLFIQVLFAGCGRNRQHNDNVSNESSSDNTESSGTNREEKEPTVGEKEMKKQSDSDRPRNGDKPYDSYFRYIKIDLNDLNCLRAINDTEYDALISIVQKQTDRTTRCVYVRSKENFLISRIPNGKYYIKIYLGSDWNKNKSMKNGEIRGGFDKNSRFVKFPEILKIEQTKSKSTESYFNGEWKFFEMLNVEGSSVSVNEDEFFGN